MKQILFRVVFTTGQEEQVYAFNGQEAVIVAQARQIGKGNSYEVKSYHTNHES